MKEEEHHAEEHTVWHGSIDMNREGGGSGRKEEVDVRWGCEQSEGERGRKKDAHPSELRTLPTPLSFSMILSSSLVAHAFHLSVSPSCCDLVS